MITIVLTVALVVTILFPHLRARSLFNKFLDALTSYTIQTSRGTKGARSCTICSLLSLMLHFFAQPAVPYSVKKVNEQSDYEPDNKADPGNFRQREH